MRLRIFILIVISTPPVRLRIGGAADAVTTAYGGVVRFLRETCMFVLESNHPSHRSVARPTPPIRKRQEGYLFFYINLQVFTPHFSFLNFHSSLPQFSFLTSHFSFLTSYFSLLTSHSSLLTSHFSFLTYHFSFLTSHFSFLTSHFSLIHLLFTFYFLLFTFTHVN